jgi:glycosyltransferase involved in cell wall biosynthesis
MVIVESFACGTPVAGVAHSAIPELVTGDVGVLAQPEDAISLAEACLATLELSQRPETADACRAAAMPYDWDLALAPRMEELYTS